MNFFVFYYMIYLVLNNEEKGYIMKRKIPKITNSEKQILEVLWDEEKPLTSSEIVGVSDDRTWKASSVHLLLNSLLNKDLVEVAGFKKTTKNYARTFQHLNNRALVFECWRLTVDTPMLTILQTFLSIQCLTKYIEQPS